MGKKCSLTDDIYYKYPACIPFLSMWYWPNVLISKLGSLFNQDIAFKLYSYFILAHYLLASIIAYQYLGLFGAITLTYAGYCIKPQTPSFVYTMCWMPGMLIGGWFGVFSCFMAITGGYWPILVYFMPVAIIVNPICLLGIIPALPTILAFSWYWPKSVRSKQKVDRNFGKIPWWKLKDLFIPTNNIGTTNGVHYPEVEMYVGIAILLLFSHLSIWHLGILTALLIALGIVTSVQRIPSRALYLLTLSICGAVSAKEYLPILTFLQGYLLFQNASIYPSFPFSQWWDRPSKLYHKKPKANNWPFITGYLENKKISDYKGAFSLAN